jgi:hypothetical protein
MRFLLFSQELGDDERTVERREMPVAEMSELLALLERRAPV